MSWAKIDDRANENPKQLDAGAKACWLWACGLMYCNRQQRKTGRIPKAAVRMLYPGLGFPEAKRLVKAGLWHDEGDHYQVHDYHGWNPELREKRAAAGRKGGVRSGKARRKATPEQTSKQLASPNEANLEATCLPRAQTRAGSTPPHPTGDDPSGEGDPNLTAGADEQPAIPPHRRPEVRAFEQHWTTTRVEAWGGWTPEQRQRLVAAGADPERQERRFRNHYRDTGHRSSDWGAKADNWVDSEEHSGSRAAAGGAEEDDTPLYHEADA